ncbi:MAG: hypothetical protein KGZ59_03915 [Chitinophagaceae bacterium]|nr:hypothetical protein [Chitinophagaceae bacterium]
MRNLLVPLLYFILCFSFKAQEKQKRELTFTKWECKIAEDCINTYEFITDSTFKFFSCEMEDVYFRDYYFKDGFLMLDEKESIYDKNLTESSIHRSERKLYKVIIEKDKLKHLSMSTWTNDKWVQSDFKFDSNYIYIKK